jgi:hypothetical protein
LDGAAAAPTEREEGKADGSKVAAARVGCCVLAEMLYSVDVLYGTILLHNYEMLAFPNIKMRGTDDTNQILTARGLRMVWGSGGTVIGWRRCCTHGERGGKSRWK